MRMWSIGLIMYHQMKLYLSDGQFFSSVDDEEGDIIAKEKRYIIVFSNQPSYRGLALRLRFLHFRLAFLPGYFGFFDGDGTDRNLEGGGLFHQLFGENWQHTVNSGRLEPYHFLGFSVDDCVENFHSFQWRW